VSDNRVASGFDDQSVRVWDLVSGQCIKALDGLHFFPSRHCFGRVFFTPHFEPFVCHTDESLCCSLISPDGTRWIGVYGSSVVFASNSHPEITEEMRVQVADSLQFRLTQYTAARATGLALNIGYGRSKRMKLVACEFLLSFIRKHGLPSLWGILHDPKYNRRYRAALRQGRLGEMFAEALRAALPSSEQGLPLPPY
jgi:hypothetical protein